MGIYIIFSQLDGVGGSANYVNSKVKYLQKNNWRVIVFSSKIKEIASFPFPNLNQFFDNRRLEFRYAPNYWSSKRVNEIMAWMKSVVKKDEEKVIIESSDDNLAVWGEMLAKELGAKHFCFLLAERTEACRAKEFLYFKYKRGELAGIHKNSIPRIFKNYQDVNECDCPVLRAANYGAVQDVENRKVNSLKKMDWDIAYIGRNKQYVDNIVDDVMKFAMRHRDKQIHFLILGDIGDATITVPKNVNIEKLGFMVPIPRSFFQHIDVVIAGAGCASLSQREGVLTIVADASTCMSNGLLGYTTMDTLFSNDMQERFDVTLEKALVEKEWKNMPYSALPVHSEDEIEQFYMEHFRFIEQSDQTKVYFDFQKKRQRDYTLMDYMRFYMRIYTPRLFSFASKMKKDIKRKIRNE